MRRFLTTRNSVIFSSKAIQVLPAIVSVTVLFAMVGCSRAAGLSKAVERYAYSHLLVPSEYPSYGRRRVKPPGWKVFDNRTQFITLRGFPIRNGKIVDIRKTLDQYTGQGGLGRIIWPSYPILFAKNLNRLVKQIKQRNLYLFDIWGYVPGSGPPGYWQQFKVPRNILTMLKTKLGNHWLGTDIGEQDGRYIWRYASQMTPPNSGRFYQYLNFERYLAGFGRDIGHRNVVLASQMFAPYMLKYGDITLVGAETAQALPNDQVFYSFIRGAGKEYGVPWFGNVSVYNRWGHKSYGPKANPAAGTSLSLMQRLMYSQILYNCVAVGFESGWFYPSGKLTPIGRIQRSAEHWVRHYGQPGVQYTPIAILLDFDAGWNAPRTLYSPNIYRVWGNLPYRDSDYQTDDVLNMIYPGYADASYFHNEFGFSTATPYGDIVDCLLSDSPLWLLKHYSLIVVTAKSRCRELRDKLAAYVADGGHLVLFGKNWVTPSSTDRITVIPGNGLTKWRPVRGNHIDQHIESPRPLTATARRILNQLFKTQRLFAVDPRLDLVICRKRTGDYTLGILNNTWHPLPLSIHSLCGPIESIKELPVNDSQQTAAGYTPPGISLQSLGMNTATTIAGGAVRIFTVRVKEAGVVDVPDVKPPALPKNIILATRDIRSIQEAILRRPTFFQHFGGIMISWRYLRDVDKRGLVREDGWIQRQGLRVFVDLSSGVNLYPDLRLLDNIPQTYKKSMRTIQHIIAKMPLIGSHRLLLTLHELPENNYVGGWDGFVPAMKQICAEARTHDITVYLRLQPHKTPRRWRELVSQVGASNLSVAAPLEFMQKGSVKGIGLWLATSLAQLRGLTPRSGVPTVLDMPMQKNFIWYGHNHY